MKCEHPIAGQVYKRVASCVALLAGEYLEVKIPEAYLTFGYNYCDPMQLVPIILPWIGNRRENAQQRLSVPVVVLAGGEWVVRGGPVESSTKSTSLPQILKMSTTNPFIAQAFYAFHRMGGIRRQYIANKGGRITG
jgi:hypothetical protein